MRISGWRLFLEAAAVFAGALAFLLLLAPSAPFTKELGVCESGAVRDVLAGHILLPHFLPGPIVHVPPMYWWTAALCVHFLGWTELALRLPSLVPAALTSAIVFAWSASVLNRRTGLWSAAALTLCHFTIDAARQPRMDAMLALFVTAAIICLERALFDPAPIAVIDSLSLQELRAIFAVPPGFALRGHLLTMEDGLRGPRATLLWFASAALLIGLGILSKGILGIALPGLAVALYLIARQHLAALFRPGLIAAFTGGLAIGLAWYAAGYALGGWQFLHWQLAMNLWNRFLPVEAGGAGYCAHPFWYFAPVTIAGFVPWSLYLPAAAIGLWTRRRSLPQPIVFVLCWFAAIFLFFSASTGKCLIYILPVLPPLAIIIGFIIDSLQKDAGAQAVADFDPPVEPADTVAAAAFQAGTIAIAAGAAVIVLAAIVVIVRGLPAQLPLRLHPTDRRFLEIFAGLAARVAPSLILWLIAFTAGVIAAIAGLRKRSPAFQALGAGLIAFAGGLFWFGAMNPALAKRETLRDFAHQVAATVPPGTTVGHIGLGDCDLSFYSPAPLPYIFHFRCDEAGSLPRYIVIREQAFDAITPAQRACLKPILQSAPVDSLGPRLLLERTN